MEFNLTQSIEILERTPVVLENLLGNLSSDWILNNEGPETWSPYDVLGHLIHGEHTDWPARINKVLDPNLDSHFDPFDRFAQFNESQGKSVLQLLDEFALLREQNLTSVKQLKISESDLLKTGIHPSFGEVTLKQLLATWVTHDLGHLGQIVRVMAKQYTDEVGPWKQYMGILNRQ